MKPEIEKYFTSPNGTRSSTRLFSYLMLRFFIAFNIITLFLITILVYAVGRSGIDINILLVTGSYWFAFNILLAIMIFLPKQLNKIEEIRKTIELAKNDKDIGNKD
jgi:hypothetical protein